ncbi:MAG TPA: sigma-54 dependent transcriptional regulator [Vicinamibacterales bacterium]
MTATLIPCEATRLPGLYDPRLNDQIVSQSPGLREALHRLTRVAPLDTTVLFTGETGTGKNLLARRLHQSSRRSARPLVSVNLASIPETLVAPELFGHEQGAFTGATHRRIGRFELADRATLFLDEVGQLSPEMQVSILRVIQDGEYERLGASHTRSADVRLIAATNRNLEQAVEEGRFRADLYYRLSVFPIHLPPLRERREDIPALIEHFLSALKSGRGRPFDRIDAASIARLVAFSWPGNIRQLQNVLEQSAILSDDVVLRVPGSLLVERRPGMTGASRLDALVHDSEQRLIEEALSEARGRVSGAAGAAARLGVPASTLESKIRRFNIDKLRFRA